ncbi:MAG: RIP metalloprotease RseP [Candidatus Magnetoovum sp. WYHC-5]|nr:RIP metalloprotease RseP [Candidatus Magnetoovum sp. WYHC-5]
MTVVYAILLLGILIFVHELGHFLFAKLMGIKVLKFSIGFGPKLISKQLGETEYILAAVPLGGYVKMLGDDSGEEVSEEDKARSYSHQPVYKRAFVIVAGSLFNILFAALIFAGFFIHGIPRYFSTIGEVMNDMPAKTAGMLKGDKVTSIDGVAIKYWDEMTEIIYSSPEKVLSIVVQRDGISKQISIKPKKDKSKNAYGEDIDIGLIGVKPSEHFEVIKYGFFKSMYLGAEKTAEVIWMSLVGLYKMIFTKSVTTDDLGGPIFIVQLAKKQAASGFANFVTFMAIISINLGVFNMFPIPVLDGGHMMFLTIEGIRRKPLNDKIIITAHKIGLSLLLLLAAFVFYNDIVRIVYNKELP